MAEQITKKRCAIYTRKSTDEGLDMDFNSLDAQREACENYIRSQVAKGWQILPEHYDDGGFSGGITYCIAANKHKYYTLFPGRTKKALYQSLFRISTGRFFIRSFRLKEDQ